MKNIRLSRTIPAYIEHQRNLNYSPWTQKSSLKSLKQLSLYFKAQRKGDPRLSEIIRKDMVGFHDMRNEGHALETVNGDMRRVSTFLKWVTKKGYILFNPMQGMSFKTPPRDISRKTISEKEVERVLNCIDMTKPTGIRDRAIIELMFSTGLRRSEVRGLNLFDIDFEAETVRVNQGKGKKDRIIPLGHRAKEWLKRYVALARSVLLESRTEGALFVSNKRGRMCDRALAKTIYTRMNRAGLKYSCHSLRHGFATALLRRGAEITHIQAMLGHASIDSTQIYTEVVTEDLRKTLERSHPGA